MTESIYFSKQAFIELYLLDSDDLKPCVIVVPGGGYLQITENEATPVAQKLNHYGFHAICLHYTTNHCPYPQPLEELDQALLYLEKKATDYKVDLNKVMLLGFSAGGHLIANYLSMPYFQRKSKLPIAAQVLCYPLLEFPLLEDLKDKKIQMLYQFIIKAIACSQDELKEISPIDHVHANLPPTFIWHTVDDAIVFSSSSLKYVQA